VPEFAVEAGVDSFERVLRGYNDVQK